MVLYSGGEMDGKITVVYLVVVKAFFVHVELSFSKYAQTGLRQIGESSAKRAYMSVKAFVIVLL